jgi:uncharacterized membrane protein
MTLSDRATAYLRTLWPLLLGHLTAWALTHVDALGLPVNNVLVAEIVAFAATAVVYAAGRWAEECRSRAWWARAARGAGRILLSLGLDTGGPPAYRTRRDVNARTPVYHRE